MHVQVGGQKDLFRLAHNLNAAGQKGLKRELDKGVTAAGKVIADAVTDPTSIAQHLPQGYEPPWARSVKTKLEKQMIRARRVTVVVWADGRSERRDIVKLNAGILKHPVYGRFRRLKDGSRQANPWVVQRIRPGLVDEPARRAMPRAVKKIEDAVKRVTQQIEAG